MERHRLTFLVISDPSQPAQTLRVSQRSVRFAVAGIAAALLFILVASRTSTLERENALLVADVAPMQ